MQDLPGTGNVMGREIAQNRQRMFLRLRSEFTQSPIHGRPKRRKVPSFARLSEHPHFKPSKDSQPYSVPDERNSAIREEMKKTFPIQVTDKVTDRVVESIKGEVRKYVKRERRKAIPEGFDQWDFDCKVGPDEASAQTVSSKEIFPAIDALAQAGGAQVYIEILARPGNRFPTPIIPTVAATQDGAAPSTTI
jgi:hypothetical protein